MTVTARRLYYLSATVIFLALAPLTVWQAAGYHWTGWHQGFVKNGSATFYSSPSADVYLNGEKRGRTPLHLPKLAPGTYRVEFHSKALTTWRTTIRVTSGSANTIGPIALLPTAVETETIPDTAWPKILTDEEHGFALGVRQDQATWTVASLWPSDIRLTTSIPTNPIAVSSNPPHSVIIVDHGTTMSVIRANQPAQPWIIPHLDHLTWLPANDAMALGLRDGHLIQCDTQASTTADLGPADSFGLLDTERWWVTLEGQQTNLWRQSSSSQQAPTLVERLPGRWEILAARKRSIILRDQATRQAVIYQLPGFGQPIVKDIIGTIDTLWWNDDAEPMIWQDGVQLFSRFDQHTTSLLVRGPEEYQLAGWTSVGQILATVDQGVFNLRGTNDQQGYQVILTTPISPDQHVVLWQPSKRMFIRTTGSSLEKVSW